MAKYTIQSNYDLKNSSPLFRRRHCVGFKGFSEGSASPALFWKSQKSALFLGKNILIVSICELNVSFEMQL